MDTDRLIAWDVELRAVHARLREALSIARGAVDGGQADAATRDLLPYCAGFCAALDGHHRSEDTGLFPALVAERPELRPVVEKLMQDHSMLSYLLGQFRAALDAGVGRDALDRHLEGIAAIMESHFRFEERELLEPLAALRSSATRSELLGPLG